MEILCSIIAILFSILAAVFGVKRRVHSSRPNTNGRVCDEGSRYNDLVSNNKRLEREQTRVEELDERDAANIQRCADISSRIQKREQETPDTE